MNVLRLTPQTNTIKLIPKGIQLGSVDSSKICLPFYGMHAKFSARTDGKAMSTTRVSLIYNGLEAVTIIITTIQSCTFQDQNPLIFPQGQLLK